MKVHKSIICSKINYAAVSYLSESESIYKMQLLQQLNGLNEHSKVYTDGSKTGIGPGCAFTNMDRQCDQIFPMH